MKKWFGLWLLVNVADLATTLVCVSLGGGEGNLLLRGLVHSSAWGTIAYKMLMSAVVGLVLARLGLLGLLRVCTLMVGLVVYANGIWMAGLVRYSDVLTAGGSGFWGVVLVGVCVAGALAAYQAFWGWQGFLYRHGGRS